MKENNTDNVNYNENEIVLVKNTSISSSASVYDDSYEYDGERNCMNATSYYVDI